MQSFDLADGYSAVCESEGTRSGFRHIAVLMKNGTEISRTKVTYLNRTWEAFQFQTALQKLVEKNFKGDELKRMLEAIEKRRR